MNREELGDRKELKDEMALVEDLDKDLLVELYQLNESVNTGNNVHNLIKKKDNFPVTERPVPTSRDSSIVKILSTEKSKLEQQLQVLLYSI